MFSLLKKVNHIVSSFFSHRAVFLSLTAIIVFLCAAASVSSVNTYVVHDGENVSIYNSRTQNTADAISEFGISIDETKYVEMPETPEHGVAQIYIYPKKQITLKIGETTTVLYTKKAETLSELFKNNNIVVGENDIVSHPLSTLVSDGMQAEITRVSFITKNETTVLPYSVEKRPCAEITKGMTRTVQNGINGSKETTYLIELRNGKEVTRQVQSEKVISQPVNKIIEYGTKPKITSGTVTTWSGNKLNYKNKISMTATAYTTERTSDKITATGKVAQVGYVAVDPRVIPLGSKLYIVSADGKSWCYGTAVAADTGVRGNKVDLFFNTYKECINFGRRKATVYVLK